VKSLRLPIQDKRRPVEYVHPYALTTIPTEEETEFSLALEKFRHINQIRFPSNSQVLWVLGRLGYHNCKHCGHGHGHGHSERKRHEQSVQSIGPH
jgi:hypothetical protein